MYNKDLLSDVKKLKAINITGKDLTKDQLIQAYILLYPFIASEFVHREDMILFISKLKLEFDTEVEKLNLKLDLLTKEAQNHIHAANGTAPSVSAKTLTAPSLTLWKTEPNDFTFGESLITDSSSYTKNLNHRTPSAEPTQFTPKVSISTAFTQAIKFVPFDIGGDQLNTGDNSFVNQSKL